VEPTRHLQPQAQSVCIRVPDSFCPSFLPDFSQISCPLIHGISSINTSTYSTSQTLENLSRSRQAAPKFLAGVERRHRHWTFGAPGRPQNEPSLPLIFKLRSSPFYSESSHLLVCHFKALEPPHEAAGVPPESEISIRTSPSIWKGGEVS
jgi:hypothetical protein